MTSLSVIKELMFVHIDGMDGIRFRAIILLCSLLEIFLGYGIILERSNSEAMKKIIKNNVNLIF